MRHLKMPMMYETEAEAVRDRWKWNIELKREMFGDTAKVAMIHGCAMAIPGITMGAMLMLLASLSILILSSLKIGK